MAISIPAASSTVRVSVISPNRVLDVPPSAFLTPDINGTAYKDTPCLSFLIEHTDSDGSISRLLFDLGIRADWENLPPSVVAAVKSMNVQISSHPDVADILETHGVDLVSVKGIIFSHWHFDHVGDATRFPPAAQIIVGPGFRDHCLPGYPQNPDSMVCQDAFQNRAIHEIAFDSSTLEIGALRAVDWFNDGSFYILDTPGHAVGHISALARTSLGNGLVNTDDTFLLLAGDVCHHAGELRPHESRQLPSQIHAHAPLADNFKTQEYYRSIHPCQCVNRPFFKPSAGGFNHNVGMMIETAKRVALFDGDQRVFVVLAHDHWLLDVIDLFPKDANAWKSKGWDEKTRWRFLQDFA